MDEMWGRVYCKKTPCWLWHVINHDTGEIIAYVFGTEHEVLQELLFLLSKLNVEVVSVFSDDNLPIMKPCRAVFCEPGSGIHNVLSVSILRFVQGLSV